MVLHPEAQSRAQREIDNVVGTGRLPNFGDEMSLPYVSALVEEVMRWHPVAPVGGDYPASLSHCRTTHLFLASFLDLQRFLTA